jgi:hypothetical protein
MKTLLLKTAFVFILFSGFLSSAFGQYKYLGIEVFDTLSPNNSEAYIPIDSNSTFALVMDTMNVSSGTRNFGFIIYDDPTIVSHSYTFLLNANGCSGYTSTKDANGSVYLDFYSHLTQSQTLFKIDSAGTIVYTINIPGLNSLSTYYHAVSESGDWILVSRDSLHNLLLLSIDPNGTILHNGIFANNVILALNEWFDLSISSKNIIIDSQANLYFNSTIEIEFDTSMYSSNGSFHSSYKTYKFDKYGNLLWTYDLPSNYSPAGGMDASDIYHLNIQNDTLIITGLHIFAPYNTPFPISMTSAIYFVDSSGQFISSYLSPDTIFNYDYTSPPSDAVKYLGKSLNGDPVFLDQIGDPEQGFGYFIPLKIIAVNINTLQTSINYDLFQNLYPSSNPLNLPISTIGVSYIEPNPAGNLSILHYVGLYDPTSITYEKFMCFWITIDATGNVIQIDSSEINNTYSIIVPDLKRFFYGWKKVRNSNDIICYCYYQMNNSQQVYKSTERWCFDCTPTVTGRVYNDVLNDCHDLNDPAFQSLYLSVDSGASFVFSNNAGNYEAFLDSGPHTIEPVINTNNFWYTPCISLPLNVNAPVSPNISTGNDLPLSYLPNVHEIKTYVSGASPNPGYSDYSAVTIENRGTVAESGLVEFWYTDSIFDFTTATPYPDSVSTGYLSWNYYNLPINSFFHFYIYYQVPASVSLGSPFEFSGTAGDISIDTFPLNNSQTYQGIVTGSYDPNDKQVFPKGTGPEGYITPQDSLLEYLVRFQNTGTDTAITVRIEDMIDTDLDLSTLQIEMASHSYTVQLQGRKLIFTFNNIMLPDSGANLAASNGFVQYTIEQNPGLQIGTEIKNIAAIYFDFNAPIITNMVTNTIDWATSVSHSNATIDSPILKAYPNPFGNTLHL